MQTQEKWTKIQGQFMQSIFRYYLAEGFDSMGKEAKEQEVGKAENITLQLFFLWRKVTGEKYCCADKHTRLSSKQSAGNSLNASVTNFSKS